MRSRHFLQKQFLIQLLQGSGRMPDNSTPAWDKTCNLEKALELSCTQVSHDFPLIGNTYYKRYVGISDYLKDNYHKHVNAGAAARGNGLLTDHGYEHVQAVARKAHSLICRNGKIQIDPYEVYLLLCSIQFHDIGNVFGRLDHTTANSVLLNGLGPLLGDDELEIKIILMIAQAHSGMVDGSKDTIGRLPEVEKISEKQVRVQLLSSILRFSDELADDRNRAARILASHEDGIPEESKIYHKYSEKLNSVTIENNKICLEFILSVDDCTKKYTKNKKNILLFDEILNRSEKLYREKIYCERFFRSMVLIDKIVVRIRVYAAPTAQQPLEEFTYVMEERGYPDHLNIEDICGDSIEYQGKIEKYRGIQLNGKLVKKIIEYHGKN